MTDTEPTPDEDGPDKRLEKLEGSTKDTNRVAVVGAITGSVALLAVAFLGTDLWGGAARPAAVDTRSIARLVDTHYIPARGAEAKRELICFDDVETRNVGLARIQAAIDSYVVPTGDGGVKLASAPQVRAASRDDDVRDPDKCLAVVYPAYGS